MGGDDDAIGAEGGAGLGFDPAGSAFGDADRAAVLVDRAAGFSGRGGDSV